MPTTKVLHPEVVWLPKISLGSSLKNLAYLIKVEIHESRKKPHIRSAWDLKFVIGYLRSDSRCIPPWSLSSGRVGEHEAVAQDIMFLHYFLFDLVTKDQPAGTPNLNLWNVRSGELVKGFIQKKSQGW